MQHDLVKSEYEFVICVLSSCSDWTSIDIKQCWSMFLVSNPFHVEKSNQILNVLYPLDLHKYAPKVIKNSYLVMEKLCR